MDKVLFFTDSHTDAHARIYAGVCERARSFGWHVAEIEYARTDRSAEDFIRLWRPIGVVVECSNLAEDLNTKAYSSVPAVYVDPSRLPAGETVASVRQDPLSVAQLAFDELVGLSPASFAYLDWVSGTQCAWSRERGQAFAALVASSGKPFFRFGGEWSRADMVVSQHRIADWLKTLPRPCGLFAANDVTAELALSAAELAGIPVPAELAVVGVDNDRLRCESTSPSLTSIEPDYAEAGRLAADLLKERLDDPRAGLRQVVFAPDCLVRRGSTRALRDAGVGICEAVERIRREACFGLTPADVLRAIPCSRRLAEQRFRQATGRSIGEEIVEARFARVFELLRNPTYPIGQIVSESGWESESYLKRAFKKRTGLSMREWRQQKA